MESSHVVRVGADDDKWSGSTGESGWTMYIGSPIHGERDDVDSSSVRTKGNKASLEHHHDNEENEEEEESDDSMASDASSRPISPHERSRAANRLRYADKEGNHGKKHSTKKKKKERDEITRIKAEKNEKEILLHKADSAASHI